MADPQDWHERVVGALGAVVAVAMVIGAVVGAIAYGAVRMAGLTNDHKPSPATPAASAPSSTPSKRSPSPSPSPSHRPSVEPAQDHRHAAHHHHHAGGLTLAVAPHAVHRMGRVDVFGAYPGHGGTYLVVQRLEGGHWTRFPVTVVVRGGHYRTWVSSGYPGVNHFRVVDPRGGKASDPATFTVH